MPDYSKYKYRLYELFRTKYGTNREERIGKRMLAKLLDLQPGTLSKYIYLRQESPKELTLDKALIMQHFFDLKKTEDLYNVSPLSETVFDIGALKPVKQKQPLSRVQ